MENKEYNELVSAADAADEWNRGNVVPSVEMGRLGPGYELAIQTLTFAIINQFRDIPFDWLASDAGDELEKKQIIAVADSVADSIADELNKEWGFSGAQVRAAKSLAYRALRIGWSETLNEIKEYDPDRIIHVTQNRIVQE